MAYEIPSATDVQRLLLKLKQSELVVLSEQSGVPMGTLTKIRRCVTKNPGIETVRKILSAPALKCATVKRNLESEAVKEKVTRWGMARDA